MQTHWGPGGDGRYVNQRDALDVVNCASPPRLGQGTSKSCLFIFNHRSNMYTTHQRYLLAFKPMIWAAQGPKKACSKSPSVYCKTSSTWCVNNPHGHRRTAQILPLPLPRRPSQENIIWLNHKKKGGGRKGPGSHQVREDLRKHLGGGDVGN